ncbi:class I SAM-dependent methyltransferase [Acetobacterium bakii]|uniref:class I SAM-dependent methyltransferase n=1 Tax=Acetobacterium bakii TaxID=52689 RepID=UPI0006817DD1|nr:class I SAM-dependent methyltransferase [Acetobacterium bakii]
MESNVFYQFNTKVYDVLDKTYFRKAASSPRNAVISLLGDEPLNVLDMCTGTGSSAIAIARKKINSSVTGIDLSPAMLQMATAKLEKEGLSNVTFIEMDAARLYFANEEFDVVLISLVLHEISPELAGQLMSEARRVLKANGKLIVLEWEEPVSRFKKIAFYPIKKMEAKGFEDFLKEVKND